MRKKLKLIDPGLIKAFGEGTIYTNKSYSLNLDFNSNPDIDYNELNNILTVFPKGSIRAAIVTNEPEDLYKIIELFKSSGHIATLRLKNITNDFISKLDPTRTNDIMPRNISFSSQKEEYKANVQAYMERFPKDIDKFLPPFAELPMLHDGNFSDDQKLYDFLQQSLFKFNFITTVHFSLKRLQRFKSWLEAHPECSLPDIVFDSKNAYSISHLANVNQYPGCLLTVNSDFKQFKNRSDKPITFVINNMSDLPFEVVKKLKEENVPCNILVASTYKVKPDFSSYPLDQYFELCMHMHELLKGINPNLPELEKFRQTYFKVMESIKYDTPVWNPQTPEEEEYAEQNATTSRNLVNALTRHKAVCSGYAEVLRNACLIEGIDSESIDGPVDSIFTKDTFIKSHKLSKNEKKFYEGDEMVITRSNHAFNKVCVNGVWYNCDPTHDRSYIINGFIPVHFLVSDKSLKEFGRPTVDFFPIKCDTEFNHDLLNPLFPNYFRTFLKYPNREEAKKFLEFESRLDENAQLPDPPIQHKENLFTRLKKVFLEFSRKIFEKLPQNNIKLISDSVVAKNVKPERRPAWELSSTQKEEVDQKLSQNSKTDQQELKSISTEENERND